MTSPSDENKNNSKNDQNRELLRKLKKIECRDATFHDQAPALVLDKALGSKIWDANGKEYIDLCAGFGALPLGHNHPAIMKNIKEKYFSEKPNLMHGLGDVHPSTDKVDLLDKLFKILPAYLGKAALAATGGQAVEIAMKTAMLATSGCGFIAFKNGYHGLDLGSLPLLDRKDFREPFEGWIKPKKVEHLEFGCPQEQIELAIDRQTKNGTKTAAIIVEPIQGRAGTILPPDGWLKELKEISIRKGILLIFDEIFTGLGRSGQISFSESVECDLLCLGKALGGGMPMSVCVGTTAVMDSWPLSEGEAIHTGTFFGHPLSCSVGKATLDQIEKENIIAVSKEKGAWFRNLLKDEFSGFKKVKEVRGSGMMTAIEFQNRGDGAVMMEKLREIGVIAIPSGEFGQCLGLTPALNISKIELENSVSKIATACQHL